VYFPISRVSSYKQALFFPIYPHRDSHDRTIRLHTHANQFQGQYKDKWVRKSLAFNSIHWHVLITILFPFEIHTHKYLSYITHSSLNSLLLLRSFCQEVLSLSLTLYKSSFLNTHLGIGSYFAVKREHTETLSFYGVGRCQIKPHMSWRSVRAL
jgi:hypothetical protein